MWSAASETGATDIYAAVSRNGGVRFAAPVRVNAQSGEANITGEQPPRAVLVQGSSGAHGIIVVWTARGEHGTRLLTARSNDGGKTFGQSDLVPDTDAPGNRGWETLTPNGQGGVAAVWLDHRRLAGQEAESVSGGDTVAMAQLSDLYFSMLGDAAGPKPITSGVCYCCKTAAAYGQDGTNFIAWRHVYPGDLRDIAFTVSRDGGQTFAPPIRVSEDGWSIAGCPDDGPAMAVDADGRVHVVWPTVATVDGSLRKALFYAMSVDGRAFTPRVRIPAEGQANHPQIAVVLDGSLAIVWDESGDGNRRLGGVRVVRDTSGRVQLQPVESASPRWARIPW